MIETNRDQQGYIKRHLHVIVLDPQGDNQVVILVGIETVRSEKQDHTTVLEAGSHDFIKHASYVNYYRAQLVTIPYLEGLLNQGVASRKDPFRQEIYDQICEGILKSKFTIQEVRDLYWEHLYNRA